MSREEECRQIEQACIKIITAAMEKHLGWKFEQQDDGQSFIDNIVKRPDGSVSEWFRIHIQVEDLAGSATESISPVPLSPMTDREKLAMQRGAFGLMAEDWDNPGMDVYDTI